MNSRWAKLVSKDVFIPYTVSVPVSVRDGRPTHISVRLHGRGVGWHARGQVESCSLSMQAENDGADVRG